VLRNISNLLTLINSLCRQKYMPITYATICAKALSLFKMLKEEKKDDCEETFSASSGWFDRYKKRAGWHNISWKQTTITAFLQKGTATSSA
jgi:hypothetical protein